MNLERVERLADELEKLPPEKFFMDGCFEARDILDGNGLGLTAAELLQNGRVCVAGLTLALFAPDKKPGADVLKQAQMLLGGVPDSLFFGGMNSPEDKLEEVKDLKVQFLRDLIQEHLDKETLVGDAGVHL